MRFIGVTLVRALGIGGLVGYVVHPRVVHHSATGPWRRKSGYLVVLSLLAGAVLTNCGGGK
jgi:hypothetical protein